MSLTPELRQKIEAAQALLLDIGQHYSPVAFANSFGAEDMVLTDLICKHAPDIGIFTLDTGRLPAETYTLMQETLQRYGQRIVPYFPEHQPVEQYLREHGPNGFYESVELRKRCCYIRKVEPLKRALQGKKAWITGLRREQAPTRTDLGVKEWDAGNGLQKFNPLIDWTHQDIWDYIHHFAGALQRPARPALSQYRLRPLHPRHQRGGRHPRRSLVVGNPGKQGMRSARQKDRGARLIEVQRRCARHPRI